MRAFSGSESPDGRVPGRPPRPFGRPSPYGARPFCHLPSSHGAPPPPFTRPLFVDRALRAVRLAADGLAEAFWPTRCAGCDRPGTLLCPDCAAALPAIDQRHACPDCGAPFGSLVCTECTRCCEQDGEAWVPGAPDGSRPRTVAAPFDGLDGVRCYGVHAWPLDRLIRAYKDGGERRAADLLAGMAAQAAFCAGVVPPSSPGAPVGPPALSPAPGDFAAVTPDAVAFVPCTPAAFARRGFDHMELVARAAGELLGLPVLDVLARRDARDQRGLGRLGRSANASGSFVALGPLEGASLLLLDDVVTTGATLAASARALRRAGAVRVQAAAVARVWN